MDDVQSKAYERRRLHDVELSYDVYEKELLAVIRALKIWKHCLLGVDFLIQIDHHSAYHEGETHAMGKFSSCI